MRNNLASVWFEKVHNLCVLRMAAASSRSYTQRLLFSQKSQANLFEQPLVLPRLGVDRLDVGGHAFLVHFDLPAAFAVVEPIVHEARQHGRHLKAAWVDAFLEPARRKMSGEQEERDEKNGKHRGRRP